MTNKVWDTYILTKAPQDRKLILDCIYDVIDIDPTNGSAFLTIELTSEQVAIHAQ